MTPDVFCNETVNVWRLVGYFLMVFKIAIPIILIVLGMIDLGKAVVSSDDKAISKSVKSLAMRVIAAVCVFFVPTVIGFIVGVVDTSVNDDSLVCRRCISSPTGGTCQDAYDNWLAGQEVNE